MKIVCMVFGLILFACASYAQHGQSGNLENIYKAIPHHKNQPEYWLFIHSNDCSYAVRINDMPVYTDYNGGSLQSLSFPINPLLLKSGKQTLDITLLPRSYSIEIKIVRSENKKETIVLEKAYKAETTDNLRLKEYTLSFDAEVPYQLSGWQSGTDLKQEDRHVLEKEVVAYYQEMIKDYETRNFDNTTKKYYRRQLEYAESLYLDQPEDSEKIVEDLRNDLNKKQEFKLEHYKMQFYGKGKVVALIRTGGEFRGKSAFLGLTDEDFYIYNLLLYRAKSGESLQVIR